MTPPSSLPALQVALSENRPGPQIAAWRDHYVTLGDAGLPLVEMCVDELHARQLCYSCGAPADRLVLDDFPWVCGDCTG